MPFIDRILEARSVAVVGLEKNCGKTECLNYILRSLDTSERNICVTSIGIDGENVDQVTKTHKPEITLRKGMYFSTSEMHYRKRDLISEVRDISCESTALGRVITAKVVSEGKVILSGPSSTAALKRWMAEAESIGVDLTIVDGALSRMSSASPAVTEKLVLATGAALSSNLPTLVAQTAFTVEMIGLEEFDSSLEYDDDEQIELSSMMGMQQITATVRRIVISGALTDMFLKKIITTMGDAVKGLEVTVKDFTRIFISPESYRAFLRAGGMLTVEKRSQLIALCVNPVAPNGYRMDSDRLCKALSEKTGLPVYDIVKNSYN